MRTQKVQRLLDKTKKMIEFQHLTQAGAFKKGAKPQIKPYAPYDNNYDSNEDDEAEKQYQSRKIGPFSFDIDDEIDTEVLTSEEVYKDLKELESILDKGQDKVNISSKMLGRSKKRHR